MKNSVMINSTTLHIDDSSRIPFQWQVVLFSVLGIQAFYYWNNYWQSFENYDLVIAIVLTIVVIIFSIYKIFFWTRRNFIELKEIRKVSIQKILFDKERVYLQITLKRKTRDIYLDRIRAEEVKDHLESYSLSATRI